MKTAYELLLDCPDTQIQRMQLVFDAVSAGNWNDAVFYIKNAVQEEGDTPWSQEAAKFGLACADKFRETSPKPTGPLDKN